MTGAPKVTADGLEFLIRKHLLGGYSYTQEEIDAGSESPEDRQKVTALIVRILRDVGVAVDEPVPAPDRGNWKPA